MYFSMNLDSTLYGNDSCKIQSNKRRLDFYSPKIKLDLVEPDPVRPPAAPGQLSISE